MSQSVLSKSIRGSSYNVGVSIITLVLGFIRSVLLMRLLAPDQFGIVALAMFFISFLTPFSTIGIDHALIQHQNPTKETFSTHFMLRLIMAAALLLLGILVAPIFRLAYADQPVIVDVFLILLIVDLIVASSSTQGVILKRNMQFGAMAWLNLASSLAMTIIAPLLAYMGAGLWSLVVEQAISDIVRWIGLWGFTRHWRPSLRFDWNEAKSLLAFGRRVLAANLLGVFLDRFDDFWVGTVLGPTLLGYYSRAYEIAKYPKRVLATPITSVFVSVFPAVRQNKEELSKAFFRSSSFLVRVGLLMGAILMTTIPEITVILFGQTWLPLVPIFRLMLIYIILDPLYTNLSYLMISVGQPGLLARVRLLQASLFVVTVILFAHLWGVNGVAVAANLMMLMGTLRLLISSRHFVKFSLTRMFLWPVIASATSVVSTYSLVQGLRLTDPWELFIFRFFSILVIYILILYTMERHIIHEYGSQFLQPIRSYFRL